jgi:hypothetical protein
MSINMGNLFSVLFGKSKLGNVSINGKNYQGKNITITDSSVIIDGVVQGDRLIGPINIEVNGGVNKLDTASGDVTVNGTCGSINTASGNVSCGDVLCDINTASGDVSCRDVGGNVTTVSGDLKSWKLK